jgi:hypothetical protein
MAGGYDIGASISGSDSSSASLNSAFNVTGGGGSSATSAGANSPISGTGTPSGISSWLPYALVGVVVLAVLIVMMGRKKKGH